MGSVNKSFSAVVASSYLGGGDRKDCDNYVWDTD